MVGSSPDAKSSASTGGQKVNGKEQHGVTVNPTTILTGIATALILWVGYSMQNVKLDVAVLKQNVATLLSREGRLIALEKWQADWPRNGLLQADVMQNAKLAQLERELKSMQDLLKEKLIDHLEDR